MWASREKSETPTHLKVASLDQERLSGNHNDEFAAMRMLYVILRSWPEPVQVWMLECVTNRLREERAVQAQREDQP